VATNQDVYDSLILGTTITKTIDGDSKSFSFRYIDWENPRNNRYQVAAEVSIERTGTTQTKRCDIVGFVNGIPFLVIENKRPTETLKRAASQLIGYQSDDNIPHLFHFAQVLVTMNREDARYATGASRRRIAPQSPPCWIGCCTTATCSSAAREAGAPKPAVQEKANDKSKGKCDKDAGQRTPGGVATRDPEASHDGASPSESGQRHETLCQPAHRANRRGSRSPIPSEPAPCHRPWITPQGATPAERVQPYQRPEPLNIRQNRNGSNHALPKYPAAR
jgi:hypothetical protein